MPFPFFDLPRRLLAEDPVQFLRLISTSIVSNCLLIALKMNSVSFRDTLLPSCNFLDLRLDGINSYPVSRFVSICFVRKFCRQILLTYLFRRIKSSNVPCIFLFTYRNLAYHFVKFFVSLLTLTLKNFLLFY